MNLIEYQQVRDGYWNYDHLILIPGFLKTILGKQLVSRLASRVWAHGRLNLAKRVASLELEHRRNPISNRRALLSAWARVQRADLHLGPAITLVQVVDEEREKWRWELSHDLDIQIQAGQLGRDGPAAIELTMELAAKKLPVGAAANLALMRAMVNLPPKEGS